MLFKQIQLGLIHVAVAITLVPINSTLNRVMIKELSISATLVAFLASLPFLFSPIQVAIGSFSDRNPLFGFRRTPYIILGLLLCVFGLILSPQAAYLLATSPGIGIILGLLAFGAWGMGFNFSTVSYLSLASDVSGEKRRGRTIAIMWFMMITSIILTAIAVGKMVDPYTPQALQRSFQCVGIAALILGLLGLYKLEDRISKAEITSEGYTWSKMAKTILKNRQATHFFVYLVILLAALLGQDILLEPFGGEAFNLTVTQTTQITSIWGACVLISLLFAGATEGWFSKRKLASLGGWSALIGFILITTSGYLQNQVVFYTGVVLLGIGTGLSTVANLSLMLDMTTAEQVGLFIGAWGMANALSRLIGSILGGATRDIVTGLVGDLVIGYMVVFAILATFMLVSLIMLRRIDSIDFREQSKENMTFVEKAVIASEGS